MRRRWRAVKGPTALVLLRSFSVNTLRRLAKLGVLVLVGSYLSGCIVVPLHGWGHGDRHEDRGGYGYRR